MNKGIKLVSTALLSGAMAAGAGLASAQEIENDWTLDLSVANGVTVGGTTYEGLEAATGIRQISHAGLGEITQDIENGSPVGQDFEASGHVRLQDYDSLENGTITTGHDFELGNANRIYATYSGLTGTHNEDGTLTFDPGGDIALWLDTDSDNDPATGDALELAQFDLVDPSGGSPFDFQGGAGQNATLDLTLQATSLIDEMLFQDENGEPYDHDLTFELINMDALLRDEPEEGDGVSILDVETGGQLNLATEQAPAPTPVVEPHVLALFGFGFVMLAGIGLRGNRRSSRDMVG